MLYNSDRAITNIADDLLGRASFAEQLGRAVYDYNGPDSLVIGLYGKWGTGKTSVANMVLQTVESLSLEKKDTIIVRFSPWNYSSQDNLISQFFSSLQARIANDDSEEAKKKVGKALKDYSGVFDVASIVPFVGVGLASLLKTAAQASGDMLYKPVDLDNLRKRLETALSELDKRIIVLIDDIDRLSNIQIRDIFQLVKQVGDLPNIIYILVMDREIVKEALSGVHNIDGNEYLEKIIQIPFVIPELKKSKLHEIFFSKLDSVIKSVPQDFVLDHQYWNKVFGNCIEPYLFTLRDVNRVVNTFQFKYSMLNHETSFEDLIALTTIEVIEPDLYRWIANNKEAVCGGMLHGLLKGREKPEETKAIYEAEFKKIGIDPKKAMKCLSTIFPVFSKDIGNGFTDYHRSAEIRSQMRVAQVDRFELYFALDMESVKVSRDIINRCVYSLQEDDLTTAISQINQEGNIIYFLEELDAMIGNIPQDRLSIVASVLLTIRNALRGETQNTVFPISASNMAGYCIKKIINRMESQDQRFELYKSCIQRSNAFLLGTVAQEIMHIESAWGRLGSKVEDEDGKIISLEQLESLEKLFLQKITDEIRTGDLIINESFQYTIFLWKELDKESADEYLTKLFEDEINKLKYVCGTAGRWSGTGGTGWDFRQENYSNYVSDEEIYALIQNLDASSLQMFSDSEQIKLASFVLNYEREGTEFANEMQAVKLVQEWKKDKGV